ncbi:transposase [Klebsiella pneumoniae]|uniref:transposase n=1 Tax=Klebsiella pneumoniae TaxID=573 RepID=UPI00388FDB66
MTRHKAASVTFGNDLADITDGEKIKHGLLVNLGKNIARQVSSGFSSRQHRPFRGKAKVQNHQLVHLQQSSHQPWLLTFWLDDGAIQAWYESATPSSRGRPQRYSDLAITTVLVIKRVFRLTLRAAQGFIDSIFALMNVPLRCPDYTSVSKRAKSVNVSFKTSPG